MWKRVSIGGIRLKGAKRSAHSLFSAAAGRPCLATQRCPAPTWTSRTPPTVRGGLSVSWEWWLWRSCRWTCQRVHPILKWRPSNPHGHNGRTGLVVSVCPCFCFWYKAGETLGSRVIRKDFANWLCYLWSNQLTQQKFYSLNITKIYHWSHKWIFI